MVAVTGKKFSCVATMHSHAFVSAFPTSVGCVSWCALHPRLNTVKDQWNEIHSTLIYSTIFVPNETLNDIWTEISLNLQFSKF